MPPKTKSAGGGTGKWTDISSSNAGKPNSQKVPNADKKWSNHPYSHTERKALHHLDTNHKAREKLQKGGTAKMSGQFPPCKQCHRAMEKWAGEKAGAGKIEYHYPVNQTMTYKGKDCKGGPGSSGSDAGKKGSADALKKAYDNDKMVPTKTQATNKDGTPKVDKDGNPVMKKESTASKEYQDQKKTAEQNPGQVKWPKDGDTTQADEKDV